MRRSILCCLAQCIVVCIAIQVAFTDEVEYIVHEYIEDEWPQDGSLGNPLRYATPSTADLSNFDSLFSGGEVIFY